MLVEITHAHLPKVKEIVKKNSVKIRNEQLSPGLLGKGRKQMTSAAAKGKKLGWCCGTSC